MPLPSRKFGGGGGSVRLVRLVMMLTYEEVAVHPDLESETQNQTKNYGISLQKARSHEIETIHLLGYTAENQHPGMGSCTTSLSMPPHVNIGLCTQKRSCYYNSSRIVL